MYRDGAERGAGAPASDELGGVQGSPPAKNDGWIDLNKNGTKDPYEDPAVPVERRIEDLLARMTIEEKSCQLATLYGYSRVLKDELPAADWDQMIWKDGIGNIDEQLNGVYGGRAGTRLPPSKLTYPYSVHAEAINTIQRWFIERTRLGIPVDFTNEGIRGLNHDRATSFPAQLGVASAWDRDLVQKIGTITGREARALGYTNIYSPILDLARDPRWGRVVETYSEDPFLTSELGRIQVKALQAAGVVSTPKHYAVYSIPKGGRDATARTDPQATPRELEMIYLQPFRAAIQDAGALGVMSSYNDYDGVPVTGSRYFLTDILRTRWGFKGYVVSDSRAVEFIESKHRVAADYPDAVRQAIEAGLNIRTEFTMPDVYINAVRGLVKDGRVAMRLVDDRVRDVLRVKYWLGLFDRPFVPDPKAADRLVRTPESLDVALRAAHESIVLLKNANGVLPLRKDITSILVTGPNAADTRTSISRYGPANLSVVSVVDGIRAKVGPGVRVLYTKGTDVVDAAFPESEILPVPPSAAEQAEIDTARDMARQTDAAVVVLGESEDIVGESRSRTSLDLPGFQLRLAQAVSDAGKPVVVVLLNGRPLTINWVDRHVPAIVEAWFQGEFCGTAIADVLFGDYNPSGKLPLTFPKTVGQIPFNFPFKRGSQVPYAELNAQEKRSMVHGALYPFGHGLSYTTFRYSDLEIAPAVQRADLTIDISLNVENTGTRAGDEVVQLYLSDEVSSVVYYDRVLRGFERISLRPGERRRVRFSVGPKDLALLDRDMKWTVEPGRFRVLVGASSEDIRLRGAFDIR
ncbi:MAG: glycosyl hydrolase [Acidobacteria bacterium RIFCSPLOWO2_02_FULL_67_36]|nr:MAG: glycosyl hydrolase [Acidobacteria bacterium RIFCSPLOWO2_02_FULL_67_36]OFW24860.1 MAG: glycosyl hydrolase [Acidobacteria bacterium RIFCSPLOWO2_12_FULL_66_21]